MAGTYRDEDGFIEQLRGRVKHIEEESLSVQGERGIDEGPLSPGPEGTATAQPPGLVHTARIQWAQPSTMLWEFNLTEVVIARTGRPAPWMVGVWSRGSPLSSSSDNLLRTGHCSPPNARAIGKTRVNCQASAVRSHQGANPNPGAPTSLKKGLFPLWIRVRLVCPAAVTLTTGLMFTPGSWRPSITWTLI